mgnify:CR=1 FL=1
MLEREATACPPGPRRDALETPAHAVEAADKIGRPQWSLRRLEAERKHLNFRTLMLERSFSRSQGVIDQSAAGWQAVR